LTTIRFDPAGTHIGVQGVVHGPPGTTRLVNFLLDTGTPHAVVDAAIIDALGLGAQAAVGRSKLWGVSGSTDGYVLRVPRLDLLGRSLTQYRLAVHDFSEELGVEALLGLDFFRGTYLGLDFVSGEITVRDPDRRNGG
jgi:hypothetical protein